MEGAEQFCRCAGEGARGLPGEGELRFERRFEGTEVEIGPGGVDQSGDRDDAAHVRFGHHCRVVDEVVGGDDVEIAEVVPQPPGQLVAVDRLARAEQRHGFEVGGFDRRPGRERAVAAHEQSPYVVAGEFDVVVFGEYGVSDEQPEVDEPALQLCGHVLEVAAEQVEAHVRVTLAQSAYRTALAIPSPRFAGLLTNPCLPPLGNNTNS